MAAESSDHPLTGFRLFLSAQTSADVPDRELLDRFVRRQDEAAFAALVHRHGPMVLAACRRLLRDPNDAEDACQAAFLVLARKAAAIRKPDAPGSWLHRVAIRVARDLRSALARRAARPLAAGEDIARPAEAEELSWAEVCEALDEELQRLPEHYRAALVLCCVGGAWERRRRGPRRWGRGGRGRKRSRRMEGWQPKEKICVPSHTQGTPRRRIH